MERPQAKGGFPGGFLGGGFLEASVAALGRGAALTLRQGGGRVDVDYRPRLRRQRLGRGAGPACFALRRHARQI
jgi:hypothetical protein